MKLLKRYTWVGALLLALALAAGIVLAGTAADKAAGAAHVQVHAAGTVALTVTGADGSSATFSLDDLKDPAQFTQYAGYAGIKKSTGTVVGPDPIVGVKLTDLLAKVGGVEDGQSVAVLAADDYGQTFTYNEVVNGAFDMYDPKTGEKVTPSETPAAVLAYEENGQPIAPAPDGDGPLRLVIAQPHSDQVADGHLSVKWVTKIQVTTTKPDWKLKFQGPSIKGKRLTYYLDRHSYESCAAPGCHGVSWKDKAGHVWSGVPLFLLMGKVDGGAKHNYGAFNAVLAHKGYTITLASGKKRVKIGSRLIADNENILLAGSRDGKELAARYYPLRLVGKKLKKAQMAGHFSWVHMTLVKKH